jgi:hypothetical protein
LPERKQARRRSAAPMTTLLLASSSAGRTWTADPLAELQKKTLVLQLQWQKVFFFFLERYFTKQNAIVHFQLSNCKKVGYPYHVKHKKIIQIDLVEDP